MKLASDFEQIFFIPVVNFKSDLSYEKVLELNIIIQILLSL